MRNAGSGGDMHDNHDNGENFLEVLTSKSPRTEMFDPTCIYLKKMNSSWESTQPSSLNSLGKQLSSYNGSMMEPEGLTNLLDLVGSCSIAPLNPQLNRQMPPSTCNVSIYNPSVARYSMSNISHIKHESPNSTSYRGNGMVGETNTIYVPCYDHDAKGESQHQDMGACMPSFLPPFYTENIGHRTDLSKSVIGLNNKSGSGMTGMPWSNTRNLSDILSFAGF